MTDTSPRHAAVRAWAALQRAETERSALLIADRAAVADIEAEGTRCTLPASGGTQHWYDVRPMVDVREHAPEFCDMNQQSIDYALSRHLVVRHPELPHCVRVVAQP